MENERNVRLDRIAMRGDKPIYEYDFGDGWEHEMKIEKTVSANLRCDTRDAPPAAAPVARVAAVLGDEHLLECCDPKHEEQEMREWIAVSDPDVRPRRDQRSIETYSMNTKVLVQIDSAALFAQRGSFRSDCAHGARYRPSQARGMSG